MRRVRFHVISPEIASPSTVPFHVMTPCFALLAVASNAVFVPLAADVYAVSPKPSLSCAVERNLPSAKTSSSGLVFVFGPRR